MNSECARSGLRANAVSHHDNGAWTVDGVSRLRDELAGEKPSAGHGRGAFEDEDQEEIKQWLQSFAGHGSRVA